MQQQQLSVHPDSTVFLFDLHDVIVRTDYKCMVQQFFQLSYINFIFKLIAKPWIMYHAFHIWLSSAVIEEMMIKLANQYPAFNRHLDDIIDIFNEQKPITETTSIIQQLKEQDYKIYLFSNIGYCSYQKLLYKLPYLSTLFDEIFLPSSENSWLQKPRQEAFITVIDKLGIKPQQAIFIDDNKTNINRAQRLGITTIHYKSSSALYVSLQKIGALPLKKL